MAQDRAEFWDPVSDPWDHYEAWRLCSDAVDCEVRDELLDRSRRREKSADAAPSDADVSEDDPLLRWPTEYRVALQAVADATLRFADEVETSEAGRGRHTAPLKGLLESGFSVVRALRLAVRPPFGDDDLRVWHHRDLAADVRSTSPLHLPERAELDQIVGDYLSLPYRCEHLERLLADLLIAWEGYAFSNRLQRWGLSRLLPRRSTVLTVVAWGFIATLSFALLRLGNVDRPVTGLQGSIEWALAIAGAGVLALWLEARFSGWIDPDQGLLAEMLNCYRELDSTGPMSARHLTERLRHASDLGVNWPPSLHALLDDVVARGGRLGSANQH